MRNINCRSVRREVERVGTADLLSPAAHVHLQSCPACESLASKQTNLQAILSTLETVEAPGDFGYRVRARIAAERESVRPTGSWNFSFGFAAAAASLVLFVVAGAFVFVSFRSEGIPTQQVATNPAPKSPAINTNPGAESKTADSPVVPTTKGNEKNLVATERAPKQRDVRTAKGNRIGTRDLASTQAAVLRGSNELADGNPTAFPINASYQSLKVSVDDARGSSRTISLPTVSFGSQRTLSQNATPLMASARGVW